MTKELKERLLLLLLFLVYQRLSEKHRQDLSLNILRHDDRNLQLFARLQPIFQWRYDISWHAWITKEHDTIQKILIKMFTFGFSFLGSQIAHKIGEPYRYKECGLLSENYKANKTDLAPLLLRCHICRSACISPSLANDNHDLNNEGGSGETHKTSPALD